MRPKSPFQPALALITAGLLAIACSESDARGSASPAKATGAESIAQTQRTSASEERPKRQERPLPAFQGQTLDGNGFTVSQILGKRHLLFFFNPEVRTAQTVAAAVNQISTLRGDHNFGIVGIAVGSDPETTRAFVSRERLDFAIVDDSSSKISRKLGLRTPIAMLGVDRDGFVTFGVTDFATTVPEPERLIADQLRTVLRLPGPKDPLDASTRPKAPLFETRVLDGETFKLADAIGKPVVLAFFLHTCPHCHEFLEYIRPHLEAMPEDTRPQLVGVEITGKTSAVRAELKRSKLDYFPVLFDDAGSIRDDYGVFAGVPDILLIDKQGRIAARTQGWNADSDGPLLRMRMAKLAGAPVPMLLSAEGFTGNDACGVCHDQEHATWEITQHATAFNTLVKHGADSDAECVSCHVVGLGEAGGFRMDARQSQLENVGCESCHGRGGPHLSPDFITADNYEPACATCHDKKHSLGFEYASFVPKVSHAANAAILALPEKEREKILAERGAIRENLLPTTANYVGSDACTTCHSAEHNTWAGNGHAKAVATLTAKGEAANPDCLACHTTAFGKPGGFPPNARVEDHPDLARVGCESCHGPGGDHIADTSTKLGSIVSLGDKCDSCVILQICGSCHDDANDPGFNFEVQDKIDAIRHGTIEAGTGKPLKETSAQRNAPLSHDLVRAFTLADGAAPPWTAN